MSNNVKRNGFETISDRDPEAMLIFSEKVGQ